uniref:Plant/T10F18-100 protein n=1 Tax=Rhizophora mucronata TaxID=61149 RepID=A0A2P2JE52_RHIMU
MRKIDRSRERTRTDKEGTGEGPFLGAADNGEWKPMSWYERMQNRHRRYSSNRRQILRREITHFSHSLPPQSSLPPPTPPPQRQQQRTKRSKNQTKIELVPINGSPDVIVYITKYNLLFFFF